MKAVTIIETVLKRVNRLKVKTICDKYNLRMLTIMNPLMMGGGSGGGGGGGCDNDNQKQCDGGRNTPDSTTMMLPPSPSPPSSPLSSATSTTIAELRPVPNTSTNFHAVNEIRPKILQICKDYLFDDWKSTPIAAYGFEHISGGLSNWLYHAWLPNETNSEQTPQHVLVRIYGQTHADGSSLEALITESVIFTLLSERCLGPKLYGIFQGGRIEEYIADGRALLTGELSDANLSQAIARKMAAIHEMQVPLNKEPTWLWDTIQRWLRLWHSEIRHAHLPDQYKDLFDNHFDFDKEYTWLKENAAKYSNTVVFCHNDMQEGNILLKKDSNSLVIIDFEYCSYNYRGFDIANHFAEWTYNYTSKEFPYFVARTECYPTREQQERFINAYLNELNSECAPSVQQILDEVKFFALLSHYFWSVWSVINATKSQIPFGYWIELTSFGTVVEGIFATIAIYGCFVFH